MTKKIKRNLYFKFYCSNFSLNKSKVISSRNMGKEFRRTVFRKKRKKRYYNLLNYGYSKYIGDLMYLHYHFKKENRLLKKVIFKEDWLNELAENENDENYYLIERMTIIENIKKEDLDYFNYLEELKKEIEICSCISQEQKNYLKEKYNIFS